MGLVASVNFSEDRSKVKPEYTVKLRGIDGAEKEDRSTEKCSVTFAAFYRNSKPERKSDTASSISSSRGSVVAGAPATICGADCTAERIASSTC